MEDTNLNITELIDVKTKTLIRGKKSIILFDVDGTLTQSRNKIEAPMIAKLKEISKHVTIGAVGGSDITKIKEQIGEAIDLFEYVFSENGLVSYHRGEKFHSKSINEYLGEDRQKQLVNFLLKAIAEIEIPKKRGTFIEYRTGMFNVSPIGRNCSQEERMEYYEYNKTHKITEKLQEETIKKFGEAYGLVCSIGGQISFDIVPKGWDKSYCLQFIKEEYPNIFFFGDKIYQGGNDYEIAVDERVEGKFFITSGPEMTIDILDKLVSKIEENNK